MIGIGGTELEAGSYLSAVEEYSPPPEDPLGVINIITNELR